MVSEVGTITPKKQPGNPKKRLFRLIDDAGIINRMGINNEGAHACAERLKNKEITIGGNIGKNTETKNEDHLLIMLKTLMFYMIMLIILF